MEHKWRIERKDVWAFPVFEDPGFYGIRIENTGFGFVEHDPDGCEPEPFRWAEKVDLQEFNSRTESQWLNLVEGWLADEESDAAFSLGAVKMGSHALDKEAVGVERGDRNDV